MKNDACGFLDLMYHLLHQHQKMWGGFGGSRGRKEAGSESASDSPCGIIEQFVSNDCQDNRWINHVCYLFSRHLSSSGLLLEVLASVSVEDWPSR